MARSARRKKKWERIAQTERFSLFQSTKTLLTFEVSWKKPNGKYGRRRFNSMSQEAALEQAPIVAGLETGESLRLFTLAEAFALTVREYRMSEASMKQWVYYGQRFADWVRVRYPDCIHWHLLTRRMVGEYVAAEFPGRKHKTLLHVLRPLKQGARHMCSEYGLRNFLDGFSAGGEEAAEPSQVFLTDAVDLVNFLRDSPRFCHIEHGAALQALGGLGIEEVLRLTWNRVDLESALVEISGVVKNRFRERVIPVCGRLRDALRRAYQARRVRKLDETDPVVLGCHGAPYASYGPYSDRLELAIKAWNPNVSWPPKDLRNCLPTFRRDQGLDYDIWEEFIGHAPRTVTGRSYVARLSAASSGARENLEKRMDVFRQHVIEPLDREILNIFERANAGGIPTAAEGGI